MKSISHFTTHKFIIHLIVVFLLTSLLSTFQEVHALSSLSPILILVNDNYSLNPYGKYLGEILRAEGLNEYSVQDLSTVTLGDLQSHDVVLLSETSLSVAQASIFTEYVNGGGRLIAMKPDEQIASLFGLGSKVGSLSSGYVKFDGAADWNFTMPGSGLANQPMQVHVEMDQYNPGIGMVAIANIFLDASTPTSYPAVVGSPSGRTAAFVYDLPKNIVYTRQGNPANTNVDIDGDGIYRTIDLFQSVGGGDPWVDRALIPIPQADEQQRLLARLVRQLVEKASPIPQVWYFPGAAKSMLILTGDAHANPSNYYQNEIDSLNALNAKITFYLSIGSVPTNTMAQIWRSQGHEFGIHPYNFRQDDYPPYNCINLPDCYNAFDDWFSLTYSSSKSRTVRNHQVAWDGWVTAAEIAAAHGIALDTNYYHWGPWLQNPDNTWSHGYITGSGLPMKFSDTDGTIVPVFQQLTQLVDEQLIFESGFGYEGLTSAGALLVSEAMIDASLTEYPSALMTQFHVDYYQNDQNWAEGTVAYAQANDVPVWNADEWLNFVEKRYNANYGNIVWNDLNGMLTFNMTSTVGTSLTTLLPVTYQGRSLHSVTVDGLPNVFTFEKVKEQDVAFIPVSSGNHAFSVQYQSLPAVEISNSASTVHLTWPDAGMGIDHYEVWRASNAPYFTPGEVGSTQLGPDISPDGGPYVYNDSGSGLGDPSNNSFYVIRAVHTNLVTVNSSPVGEFDYEMQETAETDFVWVGLPLDANLTMASDLKSYIESNASGAVTISSISRWNPVGQTYTQYTTVPFPQGDFGVQLGQVYRLSISGTGGAPVVWSLLGNVPIPGFMNYTLYETAETDFNWIMLPLNKSGLAMASDLESGR